MIKILKFELTDYLDTKEAQDELIANAEESGHERYIAHAKATVERAKKRWNT